MFEQTSRLAEKLATSVSRRGFLGSLGGWAAAAAMGVAGVLALSGNALAHNLSCGGRCCLYSGPTCYGGLRVEKCKDCPPSLNGCPLEICGKNVFQTDKCTC